MRPGASILIVEDDFSIRESIAELLEGEGYSVKRASNGAEALEQLGASRDTCLILLDLMMPVMDGWEFRSRQRSDPALAAIPVVVVSAVSGGEDAADLGAEAWFPKPFEIDRLLETVGRLC